jgi:hypothetical protein
MATTQAVRRWIITGSVTAVTVAGTIYGASLKDDVVVMKVCLLVLSLVQCSKRGATLCLHLLGQLRLLTTVRAGKETRPRSHPRRTTRSTTTHPRQSCRSKERDGVEDCKTS